MEQQTQNPPTELEITTKPKKQLSEKTKKYFKNYGREYKRKKRLKDRKCVNDGAQAVIKVLLTQELLCDKCDKERLLNKYKKPEKETPP